MFGYIKARRAERRARRAYELAVLESLIAENERRLRELDEVRECKFCLALEPPEQREVCESQAVSR